MHRISGIGGSERHLLTLLPALAERSLDVSFLGLDAATGDPDSFYAELAGSGVRIARVPCPRDIDPVLARRVTAIGRRERPDLVHTHLVHGDLYGHLLAVAAGSRLVTTKHNDDRFRTGPYRHVDRLLARRASAVITISESLGRFVTDVEGIPAESVEVVHYGLEGLPPPLAETAIPDREGRMLLAIGRLVPQKGHDVLLAAMAELKRRQPDVWLAIVGDGPDREALASRAAELGVEDDVVFVGHTYDIASWLERSELLVHPSRWEGFGLVLLEAMLAGRAVVASRVSAISEIVIDPDTGRLVPPDDPAALADALDDVLGTPGRAKELGAAGRRRADASFSVARMADATVAVYRRALAGVAA